MMRYAFILLAAIGLFGLYCASAFGDGGQVRAVQRTGDVQVTVFTSPTPLCAGPVDISAIVQNTNTGRIIDAPQITVELTPRDKSLLAIHALATTEAATNKLLRAALVEVPADGTWDVVVRVATNQGTAPVEIRFAIEVAPPWPAWISSWPWFCWPIVPIFLFVVHRRLVAQRARRSPSGCEQHSPRESVNIRGLTSTPQ